MSRHVLPFALLLTGAVTLAGCSAAEPGRTLDPAYERPVAIAVAADSPEQLLLGEIYLQVLRDEDRGATLHIHAVAENRTPLDALWSQEVDMVIGCTGALLHRLDANRAETLAQEIDRGEVDDPADQTYREMMAVLPGTLTTPDPSSAQGCAEEIRAEGTPELPEAILPIYHRNLFDREEEKSINDVTRFITAAELETLWETAEKENKAMPEVVSAWLGL